MKSIKSIKILALSVGMLSLSVLYSTVHAQEYDDMYFNKSDRKTVKVERPVVIPENNKDHKEITESTEAYSAKNVNPEYIARYKSSESNQIADQSAQDNDSYSSEDYFVEGYDDKDYTSDPNKNEIDYTALALRDKMSYSNYNRSFSSPSWRFSPYMNMGFGNPYYGYGYDPFMMGSGLSMGIGYGFGSGFYPSMSYSMSMSWGTGYNPWGWGGYYPGYYSPYGMGGFYDPWGPMYGYTPYSRFGYSPYYRGFGYYPSVIVVNHPDYNNGRNIEYKPRSTRSAATSRYNRSNTENVRIASNDTKVRIPNRTTSASASNGRVSRDYSKVQNEYYSPSRRSTSSAQRISTSNNVRNSYRRGSASTSRFNASSINNNKPSRVSSGSSQYNRSSNRSNAYSGYSSSGTRRSSSSSFSTPSRNSSGYSRSSFSSGSSGSRSSSYSSGSRSSSSSSGSRSSGSSRSGRQ